MATHQVVAAPMGDGGSVLETTPCGEAGGRGGGSSWGAWLRRKSSSFSGGPAPAPAAPVDIETLILTNLPELQERIKVHPLEGVERMEDDVNDEAQLLRFLKARKGNVDHAFAMWEKWVHFQQEFKPKAISYEDVHRSIEDKSLYTYGQDKDGRGVIYVVLRNHHSSHEMTGVAIKAAVYNLEKAIALSYSNGMDGYITVLWDHAGCTLTSFDLGLLVGKNGLIHILQDYYPERLAATHLINADWVFKIMWKIVSPFIDENTRHKIHVYGSQPIELQHLQAYFDKHHLPEEYQTLFYPPPSSS